MGLSFILPEVIVKPDSLHFFFLPLNCKILLKVEDNFSYLQGLIVIVAFY